MGVQLEVLLGGLVFHCEVSRLAQTWWSTQSEQACWHFMPAPFPYYMSPTIFSVLVGNRIPSFSVFFISLKKQFQLAIYNKAEQSHRKE